MKVYHFLRNLVYEGMIEIEKGHPELQTGWPFINGGGGRNSPPYTISAYEVFQAYWYILGTLINSA